MLTEQKCNYEIDYSTVSGDRILPFVFSLNIEQSVLYPADGENQKFCYDIEGKGQDEPRYADLSHFLFGICAAVRQEDIAEITVRINGEIQEVIWGENVEIKTAEKPDNPTGCVGLKFDFPLNKITGFMQVCIEMERPYPIGPVDVCVYGGGTTVRGLQICGPVCGENSPCESVFYQNETVCVPVKVTPYANPGTAKARCCGEPVISTGAQCAGNQTSCSFTVTQKLCIEIPITFGAQIETGSAVVQCGTVSEEECDCSSDSEPAEEFQASDGRERRFFGRL